MGVSSACHPIRHFHAGAHVENRVMHPHQIHGQDSSHGACDLAQVHCDGTKEGQDDGCTKAEVVTRLQQHTPQYDVS